MVLLINGMLMFAPHRNKNEGTLNHVIHTTILWTIHYFTDLRDEEI